MKFRIFLMTLALLLMLTACVNTDPGDTDTSDTTTPQAGTTDTTEMPPEETTAPPEEIKEKEIIEMKYEGYTVKIHEPVVVAQNPDVSRKGAIPWGGYQFPSVRLAFNNYIAVSFHMGADSIVPGSSYSRTFLSRNGGESYAPVPAGFDLGIKGLAFADGTTVGANSRSAVDPHTVPLPETPDATKTFWNRTIKCYLSTHFDGDWNKFSFTVGGKTQLYDIGMPDNYIRYIDEGVFAMPGYVDSMIGPDDTYWGVCYQFFLDETDGQVRFQPFFIVSEDHGETFTFRSTIPYRPDPSADPHYATRDGFSEPKITFLPNGDILCLMRTQDYNGNGPMYYCTSTDNGYTWSEPKVFSSLGVLPQLLTLDCGVTLATYGRPGVFLRTTGDPAGLEWEEEITIVDHEYTCAYTGMCAISDTEVLLAYSDFIYPDADGVPHKTVLVRKLEVIPDEG